MRESSINAHFIERPPLNVGNNNLPADAFCCGLRLIYANRLLSARLSLLVHIDGYHWILDQQNDDDEVATTHENFKAR